MNIVVLVKQVPAVSDIQIDAKDHNLVRVGAPSMLNPVDMNAIEAAVAVKEAVGGTVTLVTMGTALAGEVMRQGIAIGADKGVLVSDERMAGSDTLATGKILAKAIEKSAVLTWSLQASARPMAIRARFLRPWPSIWACPSCPTPNQSLSTAASSKARAKSTAASNR